MMSIATDDERREVARRLRSLDIPVRVKKAEHHEKVAAWYELICSAVGGKRDPWFGIKALADRLADLIEPMDGFDLDTMQRVCFECMEGCDEPEWTLYTTIHDAIARYKRGESGSTYDRDALLALADDIQWAVDHQDEIRSVMRDFKRGKLSEDKIVEMLVLGWEKDAKTIREAVGA